MAESDDRFTRIEDELAIRNVLGCLALLADTGDVDDYVSCFTEDASWEFPQAPVEGRAAIRAGAAARRAQGFTGPGSHSRHMLTTLRVEVDGSDTASADSYWVFYRDAAGTPTIFNMGHYHDTLVRTADGWKVARRKIDLG